MTKRECAGLVLDGVGRVMNLIADAISPAELGALALGLLGFSRDDLGSVMMLGWMIVVSTMTPEEMDQSSTDTKKATVLARWEVGPGGINWIEDLASAGKGTKLYGGGYPNRYTATARDVLPVLAGEPPTESGPTIIGDDYVKSWDWSSKISLYPDRIAACPVDHVLTIDAWDLS